MMGVILFSAPESQLREVLLTGSSLTALWSDGGNEAWPENEEANLPIMCFPFGPENIIISIECVILQYISRIILV